MELEFTHRENDTLHFKAADGTRFTAVIKSGLRNEVIAYRPNNVQQTATLSPREIQTAIRSGMSSQQVAKDTGASLDFILRYEGPVLAERSFIAERARNSSISKHEGAPILEELVVDRLTARGVDLETLEWDSYRQTDGPWTLVASFRVADTVRLASWSYDQTTNTIRALDDEARWLSETQLPEHPVNAPRLFSVHDRVYEVTSDNQGLYRSQESAEDEIENERDSLLVHLNDTRGQRQEMETEFSTDPQPSRPPAPIRPLFDGAHPAPSQFPAAPVGSQPQRSGEAVSSTSAADNSTTGISPVSGAATGSSAASSSASEPRGKSDTSREQPATTDTKNSGQGGLFPGAKPQDPADIASRSRESSNRRRNNRSKVPSWDEIVFGSRTDSDHDH